MNQRLKGSKLPSKRSDCEMRESAKFGSLIFSPSLLLTTNFDCNSCPRLPGQPQPGAVRDVVGLPAPHAPLVGAQPGEEEEEEGDGEVGGDDVDPHVEGKRGEEGEEIWILKRDN